ncbi:Lysozyme 1 [Sarcoptes scabiei]|nr:Lysozyme 1 [Sarcoptes scabiei]
MNGLSNASSTNNGCNNYSKNKSQNDNASSDSNNFSTSNGPQQQPQSNSSSKENSTSNNSTQNSNNNSNSNNQDDVCRDYLRNVCRRGKQCRFKHPDDSETIKNKEPFVFCHDFQNRECRRDNCRFLHCTKLEEEFYRSTGKLPQHILAQLPADDWNSIPICKDFINGSCRRGSRCKFRHETSNPKPNFPSNNRNSSSSYDGMDYRASCYHTSNSSLDMDFNKYDNSYKFQDGYPTIGPNKRKRYDPMYPNDEIYPRGFIDMPPIPHRSMSPNIRGSPNHGYGRSHDSPQSSYPFKSHSLSSMDLRSSFLEEENAALRRRIDDLKKKVAELISSNEYLVEQLNSIRASGTAVAVSVASLPPPPAPVGSVASTTGVGRAAPITLQAQVAPPAAAAVALGPLPPVSIVSSIASISLPSVSAPVTLVNSSAAASLASFTPTLHTANPWPLNVDQ